MGVGRFMEPTLGDSSKNVTGKVDRFASHDQINEFKCLVIDTVSRMGLWENGLNNDIVQQVGILFEDVG